MGKIAFIFAGQGAQYTGMGKSLANTSKSAGKLFALADSLCPDTSLQCFSGSADDLKITANTQPCVYLVDLAAARALEEAGIKPEGVAGFSLGEMAALTFAGAFGEKEGFYLVCRRGELMQEAAEEKQGKMAAILRLSNEKVEEMCTFFSEVYPVNYNCNGQLVVAGDCEQVDAFCKLAAQNGGRSIILSVSGAFHSPYMLTASEKYARELEKIEMHQPFIDVYANYTARPYSDNLKECLALQMQKPVLWQTTVENMINDGFDTFIEVGPGKTLSKFIQKINRDVRIFNVENEETLHRVIQKV